MKTLTALLLLGALASCAPSDDGRDFTWTIVKSPLTGRCYEVASRMLGTDIGVAMMAEVPCEAARFTKK